MVNPSILFRDCRSRFKKSLLANWFSPIKDNHINIIGLTVSINITKRIKAETELKRNEGRLRTLISSSPCCIHELDVKRHSFYKQGRS